MNGITYRVKRKGDQLVLRFSPFVRISVGSIAVLVLAAMIAGGSFSAFPIVLFSICVIAILYDERWIFDRKRVVRRIGLLIVARERSWKIEEIDRLYVSRFVKGSPTRLPREKVDSFRRQQLTLYLLLKNGDRETIETMPADFAIDLTSIAKDIRKATLITLEIG
jgi:hypothetical protein